MNTDPDIKERLKSIAIASRKARVAYVRLSPEKHIGDSTCVNNAMSPYIQCAVNPTGDCKECEYYTCN